MTQKIYAPEWRQLREGLKAWESIKTPFEPHSEGWTWNKAKTAPVFVEGVTKGGFFNHQGENLEASKGRSGQFHIGEFFATADEARDALIEHHEAQLAKLKKQADKCFKKIAKLKAVD